MFLIFSIISMASVSYTHLDVYKRQKQDTPIFTAAETEQFSDEYIETILDHSMMDDYTLYQYLSLIHI